MKFIVIGITDNPQPFFPPEVLDIIRKGKAPLRHRASYGE